MDQNELVILIAAIIGLAIFIKLWKQVIIVIIIGAIVFFIFAQNKILPGPVPDFPIPEIPDRNGPGSQFNLPDLRVQITGSPSQEFSCEQPFPLTVIVWNAGQSVARNFVVVNNNPRLHWPINTLQPGASEQRQFSLKVENWRRGYGLNSFNIQLTVDPSERIPELEEANNYSNIVQIRCF